MPTEVTVAEHSTTSVKSPLDNANLPNEMTLDVAAQFVDVAEFVGINLNPGTIEDYLGLVTESITKSQKIEVFYHNLHTIHEYLNSSRLRTLYRNRFVLIDGMPLIPLLRLAGHRVTRAQRVTYVDFIWPLLEAAEKNGWRLFVVGQSQETLDAAFPKIRQRFADIRISGHHGYFSTAANSRESHQVIEAINGFEADLCLVGMGTPIQEQWVYDHRMLIEAPALLVCGACMEYVAGTANPPPRWMG